MATLPRKPDAMVTAIRVAVRFTRSIMPVSNAARKPAPCSMPPNAIAIKARSNVQLILLMPPRPSKASKFAIPVF